MAITTQEHFRNLLAPYPNAPMASWWDELETHYDGPGRYYHTIGHLDHVFYELEKVRRYVQDWDALRFAVIYHDIIYRPTRNDNEKRSALLCVERLGELGFPQARAERVYRHIMATKLHQMSFDTDANLFVDADLSILGQERARYAAYTQEVRQEFSILPDLIYQPGRKKVLRKFLERKRIYLTPTFYERYETAARENIEWELSTF